MGWLRFLLLVLGLGELGCDTQLVALSCGDGFEPSSLCPPCRDCACSSTLVIFDDATTGTINITEPFTVVADGYMGAGLRIDGDSIWLNVRIAKLDLDVRGVYWPEATLEFYLAVDATISYVAINLFSEFDQAAEVSVGVVGDGTFQRVTIPMTSYSPSQAEFGERITKIMFGANWQNAQAFIDEIRIVCNP